MLRAVIEAENRDLHHDLFAFRRTAYSPRCRPGFDRPEWKILRPGTIVKLKCSCADVKDGCPYGPGKGVNGRRFARVVCRQT